MPRPKFDDRDQLRLRVNVSMSKSTKEKAAMIGDGNVSRGIEFAVEELAKEMEDDFDREKGVGLL